MEKEARFKPCLDVLRAEGLGGEGLAEGATAVEEAAPLIAQVGEEAARAQIDDLAAPHVRGRRLVASEAAEEGTEEAEDHQDSAEDPEDRQDQLQEQAEEAEDASVETYSVTVEDGLVVLHV